MLLPLKTALQQIRRHGFLSLSIWVLLSVIFLVINVVFSLYFLSQHYLGELEDRADFLIPLEETYDSFLLETLQNELTQVQELDLEMKVLRQRREQQTALPPHWHIQFEDMEEIRPFFETVKKDKYQDLFPLWDGDSEKAFKDLTSQLLDLRGFSRQLSFALIVLFLVCGALLVSSMFRMVLFQRKDELFIAQMVGAERRFLILPICLEGALLALAGSMTSILIVILGLQSLSFIPSGDIFLALWNHIFLWEILLAALFGGMSGYWAARQYT